MASVARVTEIDRDLGTELRGRDPYRHRARNPDAAEPSIRMGKGTRSPDRQRFHLRLQGEPRGHLRARVDRPTYTSRREGDSWKSTETNW